MTLPRLEMFHVRNYGIFPLKSMLLIYIITIYRMAIFCSEFFLLSSIVHHSDISNIILQGYIFFISIIPPPPPPPFEVNVFPDE